MLGAFRRTSLRLYNFASTGYTSAIANRAAASVDSEKLRKDALAWMEHLDAEREIWHSDFVCTNVNGVPNKSDGKEHFTLNAFDKPNGVILNASPATIDGVINHILSFKPAYVDLRQLCRDIEDELISKH